MQAITLFLLLTLASVINGDILGRLAKFQFEKSVQFDPKNVQELSENGINLQKYYKNFKFRKNWENEQDPQVKNQEVETSQESQQQGQIKQFRGFQLNNKNAHYEIQKQLNLEDKQKDSQESQLQNESDQQQSHENQQNDQQQQYTQKQQNQINQLDYQNNEPQQKHIHQNQQQSNSEENLQSNENQQQFQYLEALPNIQSYIYQQEQNLPQLRHETKRQFYQQQYYPYADYQQNDVQQYYENPINYMEGQMLSQMSRQMQRNARRSQTPIVAIPNYVHYQGDSNNMWKVIEAPRQTTEDLRHNNVFETAYQSMIKVNEDEKVQFHKAVMASSEGNEEVQLNATQMLQKQQYPVEEHVVKTDDGYYLTLFRIPPRDQSTGEVVFLMHGLLGSADDWLTTGPGRSLAFLLADAGHDVYLGNARGNKYSRRHAVKHPAQKDFWEFSMDEIAAQDLPAMINLALSTSGRQQMYYAGHSLGASAMLALAASDPQYNDKIKTIFALAPITFGAHIKSPFFQTIAGHDFAQHLGEGQFHPEQRFLQAAGGRLCESVTGCAKLCSNPAFVVSGVNLRQLSPERVPAILARADTTSMRVLKQIGQWAASGQFRRYDYGAEVNGQLYGQSVPNSYEMKNVKMPVKIYFSEGDWLAQPEDVEILRDRLPQAEEHRMPEPLAHMDFLYSKHAPKYIYQALMEIIGDNK